MVHCNVKFSHHIRAKISMIAFSRGPVKCYDVFHIEHQVGTGESIRGGTFRSKIFGNLGVLTKGLGEYKYAFSRVINPISCRGFYLNFGVKIATVCDNNSGRIYTFFN